MSQFGVCIIDECNKFIEDNRDVNITIFYEDYDKIPIKPEFSIMQNRYAWGFDGTLISTDLHTTETLQHLVGPKKKYFYLWNLEWLYSDNMFNSYSLLYQDDDIDLIVRSQLHYDIVKNQWKEPCIIMEDFDNDILSRLI